MSQGKFTPNNHSGAKLTGEQVVWGREQYDLCIRTRGSKGMNMRQIAEVQGVGRETVARYIRGETWKSVALKDDVLADDQDAAMQRMAQLMAPAEDSARVQASLARLMSKLGDETPLAIAVTGGPPASGGQQGIEQGTTQEKDHDSTSSNKTDR